MIVEAQLQEGYASCFGMITIRKGHISFLGMIAEAESQKLHTRRRGILLGMIVEAQSQKGHESACLGIRTSCNATVRYNFPYGVVPITDFYFLVKTFCNEN